MRTHDARHELVTRAAAALTATLAEISTVKVKEIRHEAAKAGRESSLMVHVDVFGRRHILTCEIHTDGQPQNLIPALEELCARTAQREEHAMPIVIAPYLSPEAQALCKQSKMSFVDLEGNARLALGEIFIVKQTLPHRSQHRSTSAATWHLAKRDKLTVRSKVAHLAAQPAIA